MEAHVFFAVLIAAALHALWNTLAKKSTDRFISIMLVAIASGALSVPLLLFVPVPAVGSWPWLLGSGIIHIGYFLFLARAYETGDLAQVYPIARGTAPLLVAFCSGTVFGERLSVTAMTGVGLLVAGLWLMTVRGGRDLARLTGRPLLAAFATACFTAAYTIVDGFGVRASGHAVAYTLWLFVVMGAFMLAVTLQRRGVAALSQMRAAWVPGVGGGALALLAYGIALWSMTRAPVAMVAALRESSVLFAALFAIVLLKEPVTGWRFVAMASIAAGVMSLRLG